MIANDPLREASVERSETNKLLTGPVWLMQPIPYFGESLDSNWIYEPKFDGWRLQIIKYRDGRVECWGRRLEKKPDWTDKLPLVIEKAQQHLPAGILLDCELTTENGRRFIPSVFVNPVRILREGVKSRLRQKKFIPNTHTQKMGFSNGVKTPKVKPLIYVFDVVFYNNEFIGDKSLAERKKIIAGLSLPTPFKLIPFKPVKNLRVHLSGLLARGHEGIVIKDTRSPYTLCTDGPMATEHWRKIKSVLRQPT